MAAAVAQTMAWLARVCDGFASGLLLQAVTLEVRSRV
jgi:hypothetical protein